MGNVTDFPSAMCRPARALPKGKESTLEEELRINGDAIVESHGRDLVAIFDAALETCTKNAKHLNLPKDTHCVLTKRALVALIEEAARRRAGLL
jgi:hypothetical protein